MSGLFFYNDSGMFLPIAMATNLKSAIFTHLIVARSVWVALCVSEVPVSDYVRSYSTGLTSCALSRSVL